MTLAAIIVVGVVIVAMNVGWLILFDRMRKLEFQQQDLLLERIQRPMVRPFPVEEGEEEEVQVRSDLGEMAAVGQIDPFLDRRE